MNWSSSLDCAFWFSFYIHYNWGSVITSIPGPVFSVFFSIFHNVIVYRHSGNTGLYFFRMFCLFIYFVIHLTIMVIQLFVLGLYLRAWCKLWKSKLHLPSGGQVLSWMAYFGPQAPIYLPLHYTLSGLKYTTLQIKASLFWLQHLHFLFYSSSDMHIIKTIAAAVYNLILWVFKSCTVCIAG